MATTVGPRGSGDGEEPEGPAQRAPAVIIKIDPKAWTDDGKFLGRGYHPPKGSTDPPPAGTGPANRGLSEILGGAGGSGLTRDKAGRELTVAATGAPLTVTFGRDRVGCRLYWGKYYNGNLYLVYIVGAGRIGGFNGIEIAGKTLAAWGLADPGDFHTYTGTATQTLDATLHSIAAEWTQRLQRIAYFWIKVPYQTYTTTGFDPLAVVADINGIMYRDWNADHSLLDANRVWGHSPIWAASEIISNNWWGMAQGQSAPDGTVDWANFGAAANICSTLLAGNRIRFQFDLSLLDVADAESWLSQIRACCDAWFVREQGVYRVFIDRPRSASGVVLYDSAASGATAGTAIVNRMTVEGAGPDERFNRVTVKWVDPNDGFKDKEIVQEHPHVTEKIWPARPLVLETRGIRAAHQANRVCVRALNRALLWRKYRLRAQQAAERLSINDEFHVSGFGYGDLPLVATDFAPVAPDGHTIDLIAEASDNAIFSDDVIDEPTPITITLPDANSRPDAPTNVTVTPVQKQTIEGVVEQTYLVAWTPWADPVFYRRTHIWVDDGVTNKWVAASETSPYEIRILALRTLHAVRLYTESKAGSLSVAATVSFVSDNPTDNPLYSAGGSGTGGSRGAPTVIPMDTATAQTYDTHALDAGVTGFFGACFDGRYVYACGRATAPATGRLVQFDTTKLLTDSTAYVFRDAGVAGGGLGCIFDGRYVYFTFGNTVKRFDAQNPLGFNDNSSWESYSRAADDALCGGLAWDGFDVYFGSTSPVGNRLVKFAAKAADGTRNAFGTAGNWAVFDLSTVNASFATGMTLRNLAFDGQYLYGIPEAGAAGKIFRYATNKAFGTAGNYTALDLTTIWAAATQFHAILHDGRFLWTVDVGTGGYQYVRFDCSRGFTDKGSWDAFPPPSATYPWGMAFDGRYLYFVGAKMVRYDTFGQFKNVDCYQTIDPTTIDGTMTDFAGAAWDRKWVYMIPRNLSSNVGKWLRHPAADAILLPATRPAVDGTTAVLRALDFSTGGTWIAPLTLKNNEIFVTMVGGGGGGGGVSAATTSSGSGGSGGYRYRMRVAVTPGTQYTITVGSGGSGGSGTSNGNPGTGTNFGGMASVGGGNGGASAANGGAGGSGGSGGGADGFDWGGPGASSPLGAGGGNGYNGPGGGGGWGAGGGGTYTTTAVSRTGGPGGDGYMLIEWNE